MDWSISKLIRIETGSVSIATNDLRVLLSHYNITDSNRVDSLLELARAARERSRWSVYKEISSPEYVAFLAYESTASVIRNFEPLVVPGLLQIEEYAHEVLAEIKGPDKRTVDRLVDLRMERQELLNRPDSPSLHFIMDEAVIRRAIGGPDTMRRQLRHIVETAQQPNITIRIVPFSHGMYPRLRVPYVLFEFSDPDDEDILFIENPQGDMIVREAEPGDPDDMNPVSFLEVFFQLEQIAKREDSLPMLESATAEFTRTSLPRDIVNLDDRARTSDDE